MTKQLNCISLLLLLCSCSSSVFFSPTKTDVINPETRWMSSQSGNDIAYLWLLTERVQPQGIVVHFHGNSAHMEETQEKVNWLTQYGYDVMVFDYSGFGHSTGKANDKAVYLDSITVLNYINQMKETTTLPIYTIATSTGGNVFLRAWADTPSAIDGIIIDSSFTSYIDTAAYAVEKGLFGKFVSWVVHFIMNDDYAANQVTGSLPTAPTLVVHCVKDKVVPIEFGARIYNQLRGKKEFWRLPDCQHAQALTRKYPENQQRLVNWLQEVAPDFPPNDGKPSTVLAAQ